MKKLFLLLMIVSFFGGSLLAQKSNENKECTDKNSLTQLMQQLGNSMGVLGESMGELGEIMDKYKDRVDEDAYHQNEDGSWSIHMDGDLEDYMNDKDAEALRKDLDKWGKQLEIDMEDWSEDFEINVEEAADKFENWIESIFENSDIEINVESGEKDGKKKKKIIRI